MCSVLFKLTLSIDNQFRKVDLIKFMPPVQILNKLSFSASVDQFCYSFSQYIEFQSLKHSRPMGERQTIRNVTIHLPYLNIIMDV